MAFREEGVPRVGGGETFTTDPTLAAPVGEDRQLAVPAVTAAYVEDAADRQAAAETKDSECGKIEIAPFSLSLLAQR